MLQRITPRLIKQKARDQALLRRAIALSPLVGAWFQVLFHSPNRGAFHFSVALLYAIGRQGVLSLGGWAPQIRTTFHGNRATRGILGERTRFRVRDYHPLWSDFPDRFATVLFDDSLGTLLVPTRPSQLPMHNGSSLTCIEFGLVRFRSPLLAESRFSFFSYRYLNVLVPCVGSRNLLIQSRVSKHDPGQVAPFGDPGVNGWLAPNPGLSQLPHVLHRLLAPPCTLR